MARRPSRDRKRRAPGGAPTQKSRVHVRDASRDGFRERCARQHDAERVYGHEGKPSLPKRSASLQSGPTRGGAAIAGKPVSEVAPALARGLVGPSGGRRDLLLIDAIVLARRDPNVAEGYRRVIRAHVEAFERTARLGVESGRIDPVLPIHELGRLVLSLAFGVMALRALEQAPPADATVARLVEQMLQPARARTRGARARPGGSRARGERAGSRPARADRREAAATRDTAQRSETPRACLTSGSVASSRSASEYLTVSSILTVVSSYDCSARIVSLR